MKKQVFAELEAVVRDDCVLATNTSSLSVTEMGADLAPPGAARRRPLLQPGRADAARRADPHARGRRRHARDGERVREGAAQARRSSSRRARLRRQPRADADDARAHGRARAREHRRGDGRGDPPARPADGALGAAPDGRPARREPRARDDARGVSRPLPALARRCATSPTAATRSSSPSTRRSTVEEITRRGARGDGRRDPAPARGRASRPRRPTSTSACCSAPASRSGSAGSRSTSTRPGSRSASRACRWPRSAPAHPHSAFQSAFWRGSAYKKPFRRLCCGCDARTQGLSTASGDFLSRDSSATGRCRDASHDRAVDDHAGGACRPCRCRPAGGGLGGRAVPAAERRSRDGPRARDGAPPCARRRARRDGGRARGAVAAVEGRLGPHARARARARPGDAVARVRDGAAPPPGGRARRDADGADRAPRGDRGRRRNGNGHAAEPEAEQDDEPEDELGLAGALDEEPDEAEFQGEDPGAVRRFRFRHPTASGKTIAAAGFVEAGRTLGVLILTHRRLLVDQFTRDLRDEGYGDPVRRGDPRGPEAEGPRTRSRSRRTPGSRGTTASSRREAYHLVIADEAHTALGEKTSGAIRAYSEPIYIGMTATEQLIAKQVSDVFPASVDDLPLAEAARRGLIAPLRDLRVPPVAAINSVPIVGGDFDQELLAKTLDHQALNQAAASLYRDRFDNTPGIVYAAGVEHAYNLAQEFRAAGLKAEAVSGKTPPVKLAETLAAYERGEINILINAQLLAEGWNSPRATVCMHLAPTASRRVYQQRIGRRHAPPPAQGGRDRRRLRPEGRDALRARRLAPLAPRRGLLPRGRARHAGAAPPPPATRPPEALAGAVARPGHARRRAPARRDPARVAARRPEVPRRRRAAVLGRRSPAGRSASTSAPPSSRS